MKTYKYRIIINVSKLFFKNKDTLINKTLDIKLNDIINKNDIESIINKNDIKSIIN